MPRKQSVEPLISLEWAESLVGLALKVPQNWWVGCSGYKLHDGRIVSFDIVSQKWNLLLDDRNDDDLYLIAYDAVNEYADETSSNFHTYQLTYQAVRIGDEEIETDQALEDGEDGGGRPIDPIECTVDEDFSVKITDEEVALLMDDNKEIRSHVFIWMVPRI